MTRRRSTKAAKPKSPAQMLADRLAKRAADFASVGMAPDAASLQQHDALEITRAGEARADGKKVDNDVARRLDAFEALRPSMARGQFAGSYDAVRRFERDMMTSLGLHDSGRPEKVDDSNTPGDRTDAIIAASDRVSRVRAKLLDRDGWLLTELIVPKIEGEEWRAIVARITGETNLNAQGAAVRSACVNLRDAYEKLQAKARQAA